MTVFRTAVAGLALPAAALSVAPAQAQQSGWYVGLDGGWSSLGSLKFSADGTPFTAKLNQGFVVGGSAGYEFPNGLRVEGELAYRRHSFESLSFPTVATLPGGGGFGSGITLVNCCGSVSTLALPGGSGDPTVSLDGHIDSLAFMANVLWDILPNQSWTPYIGGGLGPARLSMNASAGSGSPLVGTLADTSDWQFAYQGIAGVKYSFSANWAVDLDYRYFATTDPTFKDVAGNSFKPQYHTHNVILGITYRFPVPGL